MTLSVQGLSVCFFGKSQKIRIEDRKYSSALLFKLEVFKVKGRISILALLEEVSGS